MTLYQTLPPAAYLAEPIHQSKRRNVPVDSKQDDVCVEEHAPEDDHHVQVGTSQLDNSAPEGKMIRLIEASITGAPYLTDLLEFPLYPIITHGPRTTNTSFIQRGSRRGIFPQEKPPPPNEMLYEPLLVYPRPTCMVSTPL